jgi:hypothetical protein
MFWKVLYFFGGRIEFKVQRQRESLPLLRPFPGAGREADDGNGYGIIGLHICWGL